VTRLLSLLADDLPLAIALAVGIAGALVLR
jgi:hypothetical protein